MQIKIKYIPDNGPAEAYEFDNCPEMIRFMQRKTASIMGNTKEMQEASRKSDDPRNHVRFGPIPDELVGTAPLENVTSAAHKRALGRFKSWFRP